MSRSCVPSRVIGPVLAFALLMLFAGPVGAQTGTATINGQVTDESGGVLPGVTVTATTEDEAREIAAREWRDRVDFGSYSYSDAIHEGTTLDSDNFSVEVI